MANMHLVTGYAGQEHVTSDDHGAFNAALLGKSLGSGQYVLNKGNKFAASIISNNLVRVLDGEILMQGRYARMAADTYVDLTIENGEQGKVRSDLIVARYTKSQVTGVEEVNLAVIKGTAAESNPADPAHTVGDILGNAAFQADMPLYRVTINSLTITAITPVFTTFTATMEEIIATVNANLKTLQDADTTLTNNKQDKTNLLKEQIDVADDDVFPFYDTSEKAHRKTKMSNLKRLTSPYPVGTVQISKRTDLGSNWLPCDGSVFNPATHPDLAALFELDYDEDFDDLTSHVMGSYNTAITDMIHENGYYVFVGYEGTQTVVYSSTNLVSWTRKVLSQSITNPVIEYVNGQFVIAGVSSSVAYNVVVAYATNPAGTWTARVVYTSNSKATLAITGIAYGNGYYVVYGTRNYSYPYPYIWYSTGLDAVWGEVEVYAGNSVTGRIRFINGYFVASYRGSETTNVVYFSTPTETKNAVAILSEAGYLNDIGYMNGKYFGIMSDGSSILYSSSLGGTWTKKAVISVQMVKQSRIRYDEDKFHVLLCSVYSHISNTNKGTYLLYGESPESIAVVKLSDPISETATLYGVFEDGEIVACCYYDTSYHLVANVRCSLPNIQLDRVTAYIKAAD